jgi:hypothetical protein
MFTPASLFGSILFSLIGTAAFVFGKKAGRLNPMLFGGALTIYPCFVSQTWLLYALGLLLTALMFRFPD